MAFANVDSWGMISDLVEFRAFSKRIRVPAWWVYRQPAAQNRLHASLVGYLYTADGERIAIVHYTTGTSFGSSETWTVRGLDGKVLRRWEHNLQTTGPQLFADGFESGDTTAWDTDQVTPC